MVRRCRLKQYFSRDLQVLFRLWTLRLCLGFFPTLIQYGCRDLLLMLIWFLVVIILVLIPNTNLHLTERTWVSCLENLGSVCRALISSWRSPLRGIERLVILFELCLHITSLLIVSIQNSTQKFLLVTLSSKTTARSPYRILVRFVTLLSLQVTLDSLMSLCLYWARPVSWIHRLFPTWMASSSIQRGHVFLSLIFHFFLHISEYGHSLQHCLQNSLCPCMVLNMMLRILYVVQTFQQRVLSCLFLARNWVQRWFHVVGVVGVGNVQSQVTHTRSRKNRS